jgi:hypothetical protein
VWFTPGTVHRLVNDGGLDLLVVMSNAGLPEAGDAVLTFPADVLADSDAYARAAALPAGVDEHTLTAAARTRRDLAIEGFLLLRDRVQERGPGALRDLYASAARPVAAGLRSGSNGGARAPWLRRPRPGCTSTRSRLARPSTWPPPGCAAATQPLPRPALACAARLETWRLS